MLIFFSKSVIILYVIKFRRYYMSNYNELIKSLKNVREYMKDFYIYGFKTRNDFQQKSQRTYDNEKRRIESWLGDLVKFKDTPRGRQVSISADCGQIYTNPLYRAYQSKSFTDNDILLHFYILDILQSYDRLSLDDITNKICENYSTILDAQIVRLKLNEYTKSGILVKEKVGKAYIYSLSKQPSFVHSLDFQTALKFYSMISPFGVVGYYILNQLDIKNDIFLIKHNYIVHTLEDTILISIIQAINENKYIEIVNFKQDNQEFILRVVPLKIYVSTQTGRRYLICFSLKGFRIKSLRLDCIRSVKLLDVVSNYSEYVKILENNSKYCWGISFGTTRKFGNFETITFTIKVNMPYESFILNRLLRECRNGRVEKVSNELYSCTIETFDIAETQNWIRSFTGRIVSIDSPNKNIINRFYNDVSRMYNLYWSD